MGFRIDTLRLGLFTVLLVAMTAIPGAWYCQAPGTALGPSISWAGGTPDETLHPQPSPTGKRTYLSPQSRGTDNRPGATLCTRSNPGAAATLRDRLIALWTFIRATSLRM
jgi:hypothetical protein